MADVRYRTVPRDRYVSGKYEIFYTLLRHQITLSNSPKMSVCPKSFARAWT